MTTENDTGVEEFNADAQTRLWQVFTECLVDEDGAPPVNPASCRRGETNGWDSVTHLHLVSQIEECFGVELDLDDIVDLETYADGVDILRKLGVDA